MTSHYPQFEHDRYEELCALATAGVLTTEESEALFAHLDKCAECAKIFAQYESLANDGMTILADVHKPVPTDVAFDEEPALARLLESTKNVKPDVVPPASTPLRFVPTPVWRGLVAATVIAAVAFASYKIGEHRKGAYAPPVVNSNASAQKPNTGTDARLLEAALQTDKQHEAAMEALLAARSTDADKFRAEAKDAQDRLDSLSSSLTATKADAASQVAALTEQRDAALALQHDAERSYQTVQDELNRLRSQNQQNLIRMASLETQVGSLTASLNDQDKRAKTNEQYLASDKDIRDLIGARNLYIADIMDVRNDGSERKPFGRVFYTKTKSLVFYAYDLDRQPGVKRASTFQVWGRTAPDDRNPVNLGMLYMDSETNKRWTLRVDNPQQLAQLEAVFVTIEPHPQTERPTGKPFLYASLRREANHP